MTLKEAIEFRNKYKKSVVGTEILDSSKEPRGMDVHDVIVTTYKDMNAVIIAMHLHSISNDQAVSMVCDNNADFEVLVISKFLEDGVVFNITLQQHLDRTNGW